MLKKTLNYDYSYTANLEFCTRPNCYIKLLVTLHVGSCKLCYTGYIASFNSHQRYIYMKSQIENLQSANITEISLILI